jgi:hypothetical protein
VGNPMLFLLRVWIIVKEELTSWWVLFYDVYIYIRFDYAIISGVK